MSEHIVETFGIVQDLADLHGEMSTPLYHAIMDVLLSRQCEEIVRCRDCKHYEAEPNGNIGGCSRDLDGTGVYSIVEPNGFCAWGEKKEVHCEAGPVYVPLSDEEKEILGDMPALRKLFENMGARFE